MTFSTKSLCLIGALALASGATSVMAQESGMQAAPHESASMAKHEMGGKMMHEKNPSMHTMAATVDSVDMKTGIVEVTSAGMALKVHFPPASVTALKSGDKITLHLGFTKK